MGKFRGLRDSLYSMKSTKGVLGMYQKEKFFFNEELVALVLKRLLPLVQSE